MSKIERITITLTSDLAASVRTAIDDGDYASSSEIIREALREWKHRRALQKQVLDTLRSDIKLGLDDIEAGRVRDYDPHRIIANGKKRSSKTAPSA